MMTNPLAVSVSHGEKSDEVGRSEHHQASALEPCPRGEKLSLRLRLRLRMRALA